MYALNVSERTTADIRNAGEGICQLKKGFAFAGVVVSQRKANGCAGITGRLRIRLARAKATACGVWICASLSFLVMVWAVSLSVLIAALLTFALSLLTIKTGAETHIGERLRSGFIYG